MSTGQEKAKTTINVIHDVLPVGIKEHNNLPDGPAKGLSIKTATNKNNSSNSLAAHFSSSSTLTGNKKQTLTVVEESSAYSSPSLISPPSSAFVSALQSPYISPRALTKDNEKQQQQQEETDIDEERHGKPFRPPSPTLLPSSQVSSSYCGSFSLCSDIPSSSSYTPPPEPEPDRSDFSDDNGKPKFVGSDTTAAAPRMSFSFPVPRMSFAKASAASISFSPAAVNAKLRSCDVFIGHHGQNVNLVRFCKWLKSELELQGIACFLADRARYADTQSHEIADRVICSVGFGIVVISSSASLFNPFSMEEVRFFAQKKNLIPLFFDSDLNDAAHLLDCASGADREAIEALVRSSHEFRLEAKDGDWRSCISRAASILRAKLGRKSIVLADKVKELELCGFEELPFPRNANFVGRHREMMDMESAFFGNGELSPACMHQQQESCLPLTKGSTSGQSEGFADEETDTGESRQGGKYISLELGMTKTTKGLISESQIEPVIGRNSVKRPKYKKSKSGKDKSLTSSLISVNGPPGVGKTELALEFAHKYSRRYKMVLWLGGEARYLRQNILNLSIKLGLDVSADPEKERGRIRNFEEQEYEAFKRLKRELFRDVPYLIIIDHLETENEWWEGKDLYDLIPRNTGGTHVIITTRLPKVMNIEPMQLQPLPLPDAMMLIRGKRKKDFPAEEYECLKEIEGRLGRSTFGLSVVGSLLSELSISPSALFELVQQAPSQDSSYIFPSANDEQFCMNNPFLMKILDFCFAILEKATQRRNCLASRMLLVGAWFAPSPISVNLLATAAKNMPATVSRFKKWTKCLNPAVLCGCSAETRKSEEESALLLVRLGMAQKATYQPGVWIQFHPITRIFARAREGLAATCATVVGIRKTGNQLLNSEHLWASAFLVFGFKSEPPLVQLKVIDMVLFIKKTALPLAIGAFTKFSRCNSALELLKVCTGMLEEVEKSFASQIQDWRHGSLCWKKRLQQSTDSNQRVDEYVWQEVTLLKAALLETRAKLLLRGGYFDNAEELCRTCISIRTVMLGHNHQLTLAAQETLAKLVRLRSKI